MYVCCAGFSAIYWPYDWRLVYITCCDVTKTLPFLFLHSDMMCEIIAIELLCTFIVLTIEFLSRRCYN